MALLLWVNAKVCLSLNRARGWNVPCPRGWPTATPVTLLVALQWTLSKLFLGP